MKTLHVGIATYEDGRLYLRKSNGLVRDVFDAGAMALLAGRAPRGDDTALDTTAPVRTLMMPMNMVTNWHIAFCGINSSLVCRRISLGAPAWSTIALARNRVIVTVMNSAAGMPLSETSPTMKHRWSSSR